jgi:hypothetical protein|tara:strand:- start:156 stop:338 length:183 start_codon:yes stop_codon:yes gene_type:complete
MEETKMTQIKYGNRYKNTQTGTIKDVWVTKNQYESNNFTYDEFNNWEQIPYDVKDFGRYF